MMFTTEKLDALEKTVEEHLMHADNHHQYESHKPFWQYYRQDMPNCLMIIREYKEIIKTIQQETGNTK